MPSDVPPRVGVAGVNVAGYLDATLGLGEAARQVRSALEEAGALVAPLALVHPAAPREGTTAAPSPHREAPHPVTLVCSTPEGMDVAASQLGDALTGDRRVIGMWWWELAAFPGRWLRAFDLVDEVWAGSRFVADALAGLSPVPVVRMPLPVAEPAVASIRRADLGLPDGFVFGFVLDHASTRGRKNATGLVEAFARAFPGDGDGDEHLVLKTLGGERHPGAHAELLTAAASHPRVHVLDQRLAAEEKNALIQHLDCYVSLHRVEGFGLTIAEAMLLGTPVVATDYGGSRDLVTGFNAWPVDFRLVPVGSGHEPYPADGLWAEPDVEHAAALLRELRAAPEESRRRAERAGSDVRREHAPAIAGARMVDRLLLLAGLPRVAGERVEPLDLVALRARLAAGPGAAAPGTGRGRRLLRDAVLRLMAPYATHQRLVDDEVLRALRSLDDRVRAIATGQAALAERLLDHGSGDDGPDEAPAHER